MRLSKQVYDLESKMLELTFNIHNAMLLMQKDKVKVGLASLDILNDDYYSITKRYYIKKDYILRQYERLYDGCR